MTGSVKDRTSISKLAALRACCCAARREVVRGACMRILSAASRKTCLSCAGAGRSTGMLPGMAGLLFFGSGGLSICRGLG
jgi:hypothetical protein